MLSVGPANDPEPQLKHFVANRDEGLEIDRFQVTATQYKQSMAEFFAIWISQVVNFTLARGSYCLIELR